MDNDDRQLGHILTRREVLALFGTTSITVLMGCGATATSTAQPTSAASQAPATVATATPAATGTTPASVTPSATAATTVATSTTAGSAATAVPACVVRPEVTEGPYYVNEDLNRADIRADPGTGTVKDGALFTLTFAVSQVTSGGCVPLQGAKVEIWHCDAAGVYSDVADPGFNTKGQQFLRGYQLTDVNGLATFTTIYPGWYRGRAVHIHFKVHPDASKVFTSQLFFDDTLSDQVFAQAPYASKGQRDTLNSRDNIYKAPLLLTTTKTDQGYAATFAIGIQSA
jgi:protocatechuate 3,4-dioxygenase beta subunit